MNENRVPDILVEQYVLGELSNEKAAALERIPGFLDQVETLKQEDVAFLKENPPEVFARRIENQFEAGAKSGQTARARSPFFGRIAAFGLPAAAALTLALVLLSGVGQNASDFGSPNEITRLKGVEPELRLYRSAGSDAAIVEDGSTARAGDVLQIAYNPADRQYGMICSIDGNGVVTLHLPVSASASSELPGGGTQQLQYAYRLDDAPAFERFYFITSTEQIDVQFILSEIQGQSDSVVQNPDRNLRLPRGLDVESILVRKGE